MSDCDLARRYCKALEGGVDPLGEEATRTLLTQIHSGWNLDPETHVIRRSFRFKNYHQTMAFANAVAWVAHQQNHHPDMEVSYSRCLVSFTTHAIGGLSENDFICAARIDALTETDS